jgi:hypothetical protein
VPLPSRVERRVHAVSSRRHGTKAPERVQAVAEEFIAKSA